MILKCSVGEMTIYGIPSREGSTLGGIWAYRQHAGQGLLHECAKFIGQCSAETHVAVAVVAERVVAAAVAVVVVVVAAATALVANTVPRPGCQGVAKQATHGPST